MTEPDRSPVAAWDRRDHPGLFSVEETAKRVGHYKWIEMRLFEIMGGWVALIPETDIKVRLGHHCYHHSWHCELWHKRLPQLREMNPERLTQPANAELELFVTALTESQDADRTIEKLVGLYRVLLPNLIASYTFHLANASNTTDAPTIRSLEFCLKDDRDEWAEGEMMLASLLTSDEAIDRAAAHQAKLAKLLVAAGGIAGPGSGGPPRSTI